MATVGELRKTLAKLDPGMPVLVGYRECDGDLLSDSLGTVQVMSADEVMEKFGEEFEGGRVCVLVSARV